MNTHTHPSEYRRLALICLYASLCSVFALQLVIRLTSMQAALVSSTTEVSVLAGERGITRDDLRSYQTPEAVRLRAMKAKPVRRFHAAPAPRVHQARTGR